MTPLVLASTSAYRQELLQRLGMAFEAKKSLFDEDSAKLHEPAKSLSPDQLCLYLGQEKARSLASDQNCVIGGDQMLVLDKKIFGKPGNILAACEQLQMLQGKTHELLTSVTVFHRMKMHQFIQKDLMHMLPLKSAQIEAYVQRDQALDCAGSYKIEKFGISLFEKIDTEDFTGIQGLPLIKLNQVLRSLGFVIPNTAPQRK